MNDRIEILPDVFLTSVQTDKFKTGCFSINFLRPMARSEASQNALIPSVLLRGSERYPDICSISARLDELYGASVGTLVRKKGEVQLALVDETCAEGFEWIPLTRVPLIAVVPPTFRWERERISIGRLLKEPFITCQEQYSEKLLPPDAKRIQVTASDDAAILSMVSCGLGVSILSSLSLAGYEGQVKTIPLEIPVVVRVGVAIKSLECASTSARRFVKFLKNHYGVLEAN